MNIIHGKLKERAEQVYRTLDSTSMIGLESFISFTYANVWRMMSAIDLDNNLEVGYALKIGGIALGLQAVIASHYYKSDLLETLSRSFNIGDETTHFFKEIIMAGRDLHQYVDADYIRRFTET